MFRQYQFETETRYREMLQIHKDFFGMNSFICHHISLVINIASKIYVENVLRTRKIKKSQKMILFFIRAASSVNYLYLSVSLFATILLKKSSMTVLS